MGVPVQMSFKESYDFKSPTKFLIYIFLYFCFVRLTFKHSGLHLFYLKHQENPPVIFLEVFDI